MNNEHNVLERKHCFLLNHGSFIKDGRLFLRNRSHDLSFFIQYFNVADFLVGNRRKKVSYFFVYGTTGEKIY